MLMRNFLNARKSTREFRNKSINPDNLFDIVDYLNSINKKNDSLFNLNLYENGEEIYEKLENIGGYYGKMIEAPAYIGLNSNNSKEGAIFGAYYLESTISKLNEMGLDTCWVTLSNTNKEEIKDIFPGQEATNFLLAFGYGKRTNPFSDDSKSFRKDINELIYKDSFSNKISLEELEARGLDDLFHYVRFAPSSMNSQPWRFILKEDSIDLFVEDGHYTDAGIVMYYLAELAKSAGITSSWRLDLGETHNGFIKIANFKI